MPLLNALEFTAKKLLVSYRASDQPQRLEIELTLSKPARSLDMIMIRFLVGNVNAGGAGGDMFAPSAGAAKLLPPTDKLPGVRIDDRHHHFILEVASVAPIFLRTIVETLRAVANTAPLAGMSITGNLKLDASPASATQEDVRRWLDDATAYPKRWPQLGFKVDVEELEAKGISVRVGFGRDLDDKTREAVENCFLRWRNTFVGYVSAEGDFIRQQLGPTMPRYASKKRELTATFELMENTRGPASDLLLNMLQRLHEQVLPIQHVLLRL